MSEEKKNDKLFQLHADLCKMLSNPTRLKILESLREGEKIVNELVDDVEVRQANLSQHLAELRKRNLVKSRKEGTNVYYKISNPKIIEACDLVREVLFDQISENTRLMRQGGEE